MVFEVARMKINRLQLSHLKKTERDGEILSMSLKWCEAFQVARRYFRHVLTENLLYNIAKKFAQ